MREHNCRGSVGTIFEPEEFTSASYLMAGPAWLNGYPIPTDGFTKYLPHARGFFPPLTQPVEGHLFQTNEWFGSGAEARRPVIISGALYHRKTERETKNAMFFPMAKGNGES